MKLIEVKIYIIKSKFAGCCEYNCDAEEHSWVPIWKYRTITISLLESTAEEMMSIIATYFTSSQHNPPSLGAVIGPSGCPTWRCAAVVGRDDKFANSQFALNDSFSLPINGPSKMFDRHGLPLIRLIDVTGKACVVNSYVTAYIPQSFDRITS